MTLRKPSKITILPEGSFDPEKPTVAGLTGGIEIVDLDGWTGKDDTPIIELTPGIEAVYVSGDQALYDLRSSDWTDGLFHILSYPGQKKLGVLGRGRPEDRLFAPVGNWIVRDAKPTFKVLSQESFDALLAVMRGASA